MTHVTHNFGPFHTLEPKYWAIKDWAGNVKFNGERFINFEEAEEFLSEHLGDNYETDRGEWDIYDTRLE